METEISSDLPAVQTEREKYLEFAHEVGGSPAFVFSIEASGSKGFTESDVIRAINIKNTLQEGKNAVVMIHREAQSINIAGVLLKPEVLNKLAKIKEDLLSDKVECGFAMSVPEKGDVQSITMVEEDFTIYGSSVLTLARAPKVKLSKSDDVDIYQLVSKADGEGVGQYDKSTNLRKRKLRREEFQWATQEQIDELPEHIFKQINLEEMPLVVEKVDLSVYQFVKPDINESGKKIEKIKINIDDGDKDEKGIEGRKLVVAANFKLLGDIASWVELHEDVYITCRLGDSLVVIMKRDDGDENQSSERTLRNAIISFVERDVPDKFESKEDEILMGGIREEMGHLSNIELPIEDATVELYIVGNEVILFNALWDSGVEKELERHHKESGSAPSEIVRAADVE
ncbi:hypothetical protein ACFL25_00075 [Patescibacteria group bacterium]